MRTYYVACLMAQQAHSFPTPPPGGSQLTVTGFESPLMIPLNRWDQSGSKDSSSLKATRCFPPGPSLVFDPWLFPLPFQLETSTQMEKWCQDCELLFGCCPLPLQKVKSLSLLFLQALPNFPLCCLYCVHGSHWGARVERGGWAERVQGGSRGVGGLLVLWFLAMLW